MRRIAVTLTTLTLLLAPSRPPAVAQSADGYRVLFLANSTFGASGGIHQPFEGFCASAGLECEAVRTHGESPTVIHGIEYLGLGRIPLSLPDLARTDWVHQAIRTGGFDYVVMDQRRSDYLLPDWVDGPGLVLGDPQDSYEETLAGLTELHRTVVASGAETVLLAKNPVRYSPDFTYPLTQIVQRLGTDLERVEIDGERHRVPVVPHGALWLAAASHFGAEQWFLDDVHGNQLAQYASACLVFTYVTGLDPRQNPFRDLGLPWESPENSRPEQVSEEAAAWIKNQVWLYYTTWS